MAGKVLASICLLKTCPTLSDETTTTCVLADAGQSHFCTHAHTLEGTCGHFMEDSGRFYVILDDASMESAAVAIRPRNLALLADDEGGRNRVCEKEENEEFRRDLASALASGEVETSATGNL